VEKFFYGVLTVLSPLMFFALPGMAVSIVCGVLGIAIKSRALVITAACCSIPMFLYLMAGKAPWRPLIPVIIAMYFGAGYVLPKRRALAAVLVAPYLIFVAIIVNVLYFRRQP
jgi:hypothetical protein